MMRCAAFYKFKEIKISFDTCSVDLVVQGHLTTVLTISISVIRSDRKMIILVCFPRLMGIQVQINRNWWVTFTVDLAGQYGGQAT